LVTLFGESTHLFDFPRRELSLLDTWLASNRSLRGLMIAAECLKHIGTRNDLNLLNRYSIDGETEAIEKIKADAEFSVRLRSLT
jgi:hypothetical protein